MKMFSKMVFFLIGTQVSFLYAEDLTLQKVVDLVVSQSPFVKSAKEDLEAAQSDNLASLGAFDWNLKGTLSQSRFGKYENERAELTLEKPLEFFSSQVFAGYRVSSGNYAVYDGKLETGEFGSIRIGAQLSLLRNRDIDRRRSIFRTSEIGVALSKYQYNQIQIQAVLQASKKYWDMVLAKRRLTVSQELLNTALSRQDYITQRVTHGDLPKFDQDDNQRSIYQRKAQVLQSKRLLQMEANQLSVFVGKPISEEVSIDENALNYSRDDFSILEQETPESLAEIAYAKRPELDTNRLQQEQLEIEADLQNNSQLPRLDLQVAGNQDLGEGNIPLVGNSLETNLLLEVPLERREAKGRRSLAQARKRRLQVQASLLRAQILQNIKDQFQSLQAIEDRLSLTQNEYLLVQALEQSERKRFQQGESNLIFVNLREQTTFDTSMRYFETLVEFRKIQADLIASLSGTVH